jgi:hypothetical protein
MPRRPAESRLVEPKRIWEREISVDCQSRGQHVRPLIQELDSVASGNFGDCG